MLFQTEAEFRARERMGLTRALGQFGFDFRRVWKSREDLMCGKSPDPSGDPVWLGLGGKWEKRPG